MKNINLGRRDFLKVSALALSSLGLAACGNSGSASTASATSAAGTDAAAFTFKHGFDKDFPPYSYVDDNNNTTGFDVELAQAVCELKGWQYVAVPVNWEAKDAELASGSCDCIWSGFTKSPDREDKYSWSQPYSINTQMIMVKEGSDIKTLADLAGKKVGVQISTSAEEMLAAPEAEGGKKELADTFEELIPYDTYTTAVTDLQAGAIDAIAIDVTTGDYQMSKQDGLKYLDEELGEEVYAIGFRTDDTALRDEVDAALAELAANGKMDEIGKKYPEIYENLTMINK